MSGTTLKLATLLLIAAVAVSGFGVVQEEDFQQEDFQEEAFQEEAFQAGDEERMNPEDVTICRQPPQFGLCMEACPPGVSVEFVDYTSVCQEKAPNTVCCGYAADIITEFSTEEPQD